jgi:cytochrome c-type biogenesis protein CcmH/NrfG
LKGADRDLSLPQAPLEREESAASKSRRQDLPQTEPKETPVRKEKPKATTAPDAFPKKRFHFGTTQMVVVVATLCLGTILVYGIMTTKSVAPQQNDTSSTDVQQQATANQPSADVLHEIDRLRQVVDKNPSDVVSTLRLSNMLQDNGFYDQAVVYYKRYVEKMPDNVDARVDYGVTLFEGGHAQDAISQLTRALDINPRHQIGYFNLGIVYLNTGEFDKASVAFKKCVSVDPNSDIGKKAEQTLEQHANIKN